jgi:hypothetical protein
VSICSHGSDTFALAHTNCYSWGSAKVSTTPLGVADISHGGGYSLSHAAKMLASQRTSLGKRPRSEELIGCYGPEKLSGDQRPRPSKRVKGKMVARGVLEAAGSTSRAPLKSATKTPTIISDKSEVVGRGAGMLAAPNAQEVYHRFLPGPSVQKESVGATVQGELPRVEESEEEAMQHYTSSVVEALSSNGKEGGRENGERDHFKIPKRLSATHWKFLEVTSDDLARGTVRELKCRLCPEAGFSNWIGFKRHCEREEAHPLKIRFCPHCGDFFARTDALKRHKENRPSECLKANPAEAEAKRTAVKKVHDDFKEKLEAHLMTNEGTLAPFSPMIKELFPNASTSKRGSRQQCRIKRPGRSGD